MEKVEFIFYRKLNDSDFKKLYGIDRPATGGGQTYLEAAGIDYASLSSFLQYGIQTPSLDPTKETRPTFTIKAKAVGTNVTQDIEFAPRHNRQNYKISRQRPGLKHFAWSEANGFPEPNRLPDGSYDRNFGTINLYLLIMIIRTIKDDGSRAYYATFINSPTRPVDWPNVSGINEMFAGDPGTRRGVASLLAEEVYFVDDFKNPFVGPEGKDSAEPTGGFDNTEDVSLSYGSIIVPLDYSSTSFVLKDAPEAKMKVPKGPKSKGIHIDQIKRQKRNMEIGLTGELAIIELERRRLINEGRTDLAEKVEHTSQVKGDGLGYDVTSYVNDGSGHYVELYIEVKATAKPIEEPFEISENEVLFSEAHSGQYKLIRIFNLRRNNGTGKIDTIYYYEIAGSLREACHLRPTGYLGLPKESSGDQQ